MVADIRCPACGEADALRGDRVDDLIVIACDACGHRWERDPSPRCERCRGTDMRPVPKAIMQKVRGSQRSITATVTVQLCGDCDRGLIDRHLASGSPIMPEDAPPERGG